MLVIQLRAGHMYNNVCALRAFRLIACRSQACGLPESSNEARRFSGPRSEGNIEALFTAEDLVGGETAD